MFITSDAWGPACHVLGRANVLHASARVPLAEAS